MIVRISVNCQDLVLNRWELIEKLTISVHNTGFLLLIFLFTSPL